MDSVRLIIFAGLLSFVFASAYATEAIPGVFGLDVSSPISQSVSETSWRCLREHGNYTFAVIQVCHCCIFPSCLPSYLSIFVDVIKRDIQEASVSTPFCLLLSLVHGQAV